MEKDFGTWFNYQHTDQQSPDLNSNAPFDFGVQNTANHSDNMFSTNEISPAFAFPRSKPCQPIETCGWFYCLPRYRQAFSPVLESVPPEKPNTGLIETTIGEEVSNLGTGLGQKRFLIFDQSSNRTTFVFSSGIGGRVQYPPSNLIIPPSNLKKDKPETKRYTYLPSEPFYSEENEKDYVVSEMQEDSEEIDALLYSDDDDDDNEYSDENDDVMSTGHSPSTVTTHHGKEGWFEESGGEVGSSIVGSTKRQKISNVGYSVPSLVDTASSVNSHRCFEDDAKSSCGESKDQVFSNKRSRKEKILRTLSVLGSIIPCGNDGDKDAIGVIDEAICYLRSLKVKAKSLGFDSLEDAYL